jgi:hypothetical protein
MRTVGWYAWTCASLECAVKSALLLFWLGTVPVGVAATVRAVQWSWWEVW